MYSFFRFSHAYLLRDAHRARPDTTLMNGQDQYAPERGVGGFPESGPFPSMCANFRVLRPYIWRPLARRFGSLSEVPWRALGSQLGDEPEVRRVRFASLALLPPSRARAPLPIWGRRSSGSGGGLRAMLEKPKFVPMARPYASHIPIYIYIHLFFVYSQCP